MSIGLEKGGAKNIGVLIFGRKRPGFDQDWNAIIRTRTLEMLQSLGFTCIGSDTLMLDDTTIHPAMDAIHAAKCDALIVIQPSIADGQFALTIAQRWNGPVILWATPERPGDGKVSSCSLVGANLWGSLYRQAQQPFEFVYGGEEAANDLLRAVALVETVQRMKRGKVGVVGTHVPGFVDLAADPFLIRRTFGLQMHSLSLPQFMERVRNVADEPLQKDMAVVAKLGVPDAGLDKPLEDEARSMNSRFFVSMTDLMQEAGLDALSLQCWPELPSMLGHWPYFAVSRLTAAGNAVSIEGDVDGAIGSLAGTLLGIGPGFLTDWLEHDATTIFFWHPGMAPLDMCNAIGDEDGPTIGQHFNGGTPFVLNGSIIQTGQAVTISRLWRCDDRYHITAFEGKAIPPRRHVTGNSLLVETQGQPVPDRFDHLLHAGLPHHVLIHFGEHAETFRRLARLLDLEWHG
jgi:L-fucose isomerase-like protein